MRNTRARDIKKEVTAYMKENHIDMRRFKSIYRRTKKNYTRGIA